MIDLLGTTLPVFIGITVVIMGFAAYMTGQAVANSWQPAWYIVVYCIMLGVADRFLTWGLFHGDGLSITGYLVDTLVLIVIAMFAFRLTRARKMVAQYPWMYERTGPFTWREKAQ